MVVDPLVKLGILSLELDVDIEVHVAPVAEVGLYAERALYLLACVDCQVVSDVEYCLFPVRVRGFR